MNIFFKSAAAATLLAAGLAHAQVPGPSITLSPSAPTVNVGSSFSVNVIISGITDLYSWELDMGFSPATRAALTGQTIGPLFTGGLYVPGTLNAGAGTITGAGAALFGANGVSGTGTIGTFTFTASSVGQVTFDLSRVLLGNSNLDPIFISNANWNPGLVTVVPEPTAALLTALGLALTASAVHRRRAA